MPQEIRIIPLSLPFGLGMVNCYLLRTDNGYFLIDTGLDRQRANLERELVRAGCNPGTLKLILLTHGDSDHSGNCAYLRDKYGAKIAVHPGESAVVENGNMILSRETSPFLTRLILPLFGLSKRDRFKPDLFVEDGDNLSHYGLDAQVLHIPGHSKGSIGILTANGELFCGDLLINSGKPAINSLIDDSAAANASLEKLKRLEIKTVYPGHGKPFPLGLLQ